MTVTDYNEHVLASLHEAGHSVAIVALGGQVESVTMDTCVVGEESTLKAMDAAIACMAGGVAARMLGARYHSLARQASEQDLAVCESHLSKIGKGRGDIPQVERAARDLLLDHKSAVERVARALRGAGTLKGEDVERIMGREPVVAPLARSTEPSTTGTRTVSPGVVSVDVDVWELKAGGWCATPMRGSRVSGEAVGETEDVAVDALGEALAQSVRGQVALTVVRRAALYD